MTAPAGTETEGTTTPAEGEGAAPAGKPANGYAAPATQADLDKIVEARLARERAKFADYDDLKAKAAKHDELELELSSEAEKQARAARKEAEEQADAKYRPMLAETAFRIAIGDRKSADEVNDFIGDLNLARFLTDDGQVDTSKVLARVEQFTGKAAAVATRVGPSSSGQGNRGLTNGNAGDPARAWLAKQGIKVD